MISQQFSLYVVLICWGFSISTFPFIGVSVCPLSGLSTFQSLDVVLVNFDCKYNNNMIALVSVNQLCRISVNIS